MLVTITYIIACVSFIGALVFLCVAYVRSKRFERLQREAQHSEIYNMLFTISSKLDDTNK